MATVVEGYPSRTSVDAGGTLAFYLNAPQGATFLLVVDKVSPIGGVITPATLSALVQTQPVSSAQPWEGYNWNPTVQFSVPANWPTDHWAFQGVSGLQVASGNVGYETDSVAYVEEPDGYPRVTGEDGVPPTYTVLGTADLRDWGPGGKAGMATIGLLVRNGMVFNAATVSWQDALANDAGVQTGDSQCH